MTSAAKHTAGPWRTKGRTIMNADGIKIATATIHSGGKNFKPDEIAEANARLIAAAPDMLDALKGAEEWLSGWASAEPFLTTIRAAIAKAEADHA